MPWQSCSSQQASHSRIGGDHSSARMGLVPHQTRHVFPTTWQAATISVYISSRSTSILTAASSCGGGSRGPTWRRAPTATAASPPPPPPCAGGGNACVSAPASSAGGCQPSCSSAMPSLCCVRPDRCCRSHAACSQHRRAVGTAADGGGLLEGCRDFDACYGSWSTICQQAFFDMGTRSKHEAHVDIMYMTCAPAAARRAATGSSFPFAASDNPSSSTLVGQQLRKDPHRPSSREAGLLPAHRRPPAPSSPSPPDMPLDSDWHASKAPAARPYRQLPHLRRPACPPPQALTMPLIMEEWQALLSSPEGGRLPSPPASPADPGAVHVHLPSLEKLALAPPSGPTAASCRPEVGGAAGSALGTCLRCCVAAAPWRRAAPPVPGCGPPHA